MAQCINCNSELVTVGLAPGQQFRCASCGAFLRSGESAKLPADKLAWRSLWLGIASVFLLFLTGIPAIYYGIRSLLRMRFVKPKQSDRVAAIVGTTLGAFFGLFFGLLAVLIGGFILYSTWTYELVDDPRQVQAMCNELFEFESPEGVLPNTAESLMGIKRAFDFSDSRNVSDRTVRIQLQQYSTSLKSYRQNLDSSLRSKNVNLRLFGVSKESKTLAWDFMGFPDVEIQKTIYGTTLTDDENFDRSETERSLVEPIETHQYFGFVRSDNGFYGMCVVFEPANYPMAESEVRKLFESVRATMPIQNLDLEPR